jgi:hypothetical protein
MNLLVPAGSVINNERLPQASKLRTICCSGNDLMLVVEQNRAEATDLTLSEQGFAEQALIRVRKNSALPSMLSEIMFLSIIKAISCFN